MSARRPGGWYVREESIEEADARLDAREQRLKEWARVLGVVEYAVERDGRTFGTRLIVTFSPSALMRMESLREAFEYAEWEWVS